jgi:glycosyltransferase involved in cell wall biosynthesis
MTVSVVMTCHNEARFIEQAVRSVVQQSAFELVREIVVVDDGSTDGSKELLKKLESEIDRLRFITTSGVGVSAARNIALREVRGDFVAFLDGDDYWSREKLASQVSTLESDSKIGFVYGDFIDFSEDGQDSRVVAVRSLKFKNGSQLYDYFLNDGPIVPSTVIVRSNVFKRIGYFDEELRTGEDTEFLLRILEVWHARYIPGAFTYKRRRGGQTTQNLSVLLPAFSLVTERFIKRHPGLRPLANRRAGRLHAKVGIDFALKGNSSDALQYSISALKLAPVSWRTWLAVALSVTPRPLQPAYSSMRRMWNTIIYRGRS